MRLSIGLVRSSLFAAFVPLAATACIATAHGPAKAQETAIDMNVHARFGRMELATEFVAPKGRAQFVEHRKGWGGKVRIADTELVGIKMIDEDNAQIGVKVAWYDMGQQELHVTTLQQKWHTFSGDWKLVSETRVEGDGGLIGEVTPDSLKNDPDAPVRTKNARFPAVRLGGNPEQAKPEPPPEPATTAAAEP